MLHNSQTTLVRPALSVWFGLYQMLHNSQTVVSALEVEPLFGLYQMLHNSQTCRSMQRRSYWVWSISDVTQLPNAKYNHMVRMYVWSISDVTQLPNAFERLLFVSLGLVYIRCYTTPKLLPRL